jgi:ferredoxin
MCEFCTEHGEGKKWYLHMKNYADALLYEELSSSQKDITEATTRAEWIERLFKSFVVPAIGGLSRTQDESQGVPPSPEVPETQSQELALQESFRAAKDQVDTGEDEIVARRKIEHFGQVLPIEDVEAVIDRVDSITRLPCGCRFISTGKTDKRYCFGLGLDSMGILGEYPDAASSLEVLDKEEAKRIVREYDEEGLMHSVWTHVTPYVGGLCNCDRDCMAYNGYVEGRTPSFFRAEYICQIDWDLCTGCKSCMSQCQFGAQFYSSGLSRVYIDPTICFGCGVCRAACPNDAITLVPRQKNPQAADVWLKKTSR